jgi:hypothetical protein
MNEIKVGNEYADDSFHRLNANIVPLFKSLNSYISQPSFTLWFGEVLLATLITGGSIPAAFYIGASKFLKNTPFSIIL